MKNISPAKETVILVFYSHAEPISSENKNFEEISPYVYGGIAVAVIVALTAFSKSQMKSINELVKTLLNRNE